MEIIEKICISILTGGGFCIISILLIYPSSPLVLILEKYNISYESILNIGHKIALIGWLILTIITFCILI